MKSLLVLLCAAVCAVSALESYEGQSLVRIQYSDSHKPWLKQVYNLLKPTVWQDKHGVMDMMVKAEDAQKLMKLLHKKGLQGAILIPDVQVLIDAERKSIKNHRKTSNKAVDNTQYRNFDELNAEIDQLEADFPSLVSSYNQGTTYEGRTMRVVKVSSGGSDSRPVVWIDCGIHAREWVSPATCMYVLDQLTSQYSVDSDVTALLDTYDFHILPVTNPDGYVHTWESDRLWRKNRTPFTNCFGVDCNRNFDSNFGGVGSSNLPCSDTYHGPSAFSEAESAAVRDATSALSDRLKGFFTIHSYSQLWMTPYGYTYDLPADYSEMERVAAVGVEALTAVHGTQYSYGNIADIIYEASGGSNDWVYDTLGAVYAYALELRDQGTFGFLLPAAQIEPTAEETYAGIVAAINAFN